MKRNNFKKREGGRRKKTGHYGRAEIFEARKMWASSECLNPYNDEHVYEQMKIFLTREVSYE